LYVITPLDDILRCLPSGYSEGFISAWRQIEANLQTFAPLKYSPHEGWSPLMKNDGQSALHSMARLSLFQ